MISDASSAHSPSPPPLLTPPMVLGSPLAAEEEAFLAGHRHERIVIDATLRLIVLNYLSPTADAPMVKEPVPPGVNIFDMMDLRVPDNVSRLDGWAIMIYPNSSQYTTLQVAFGNVREMLYHLTIPDYLYNFLLGLYLCIIFPGAVLNLVNLVIILTSVKLRRDPRNSFIVALAASDLFLCIFTAPLTLWTTLEGHWPLGKDTGLLCSFVKAGQEFPIFMSSFCIGAIACDRFRFIVQSHRKQMTANQAFLLALLLVAVSCAFVWPVFNAAELSHYSYLGDRYFCDLNITAYGVFSFYTQVTNIFHFFVTLVVVGALYTTIYMRLRLRPPSQHPSVNRRRRRTNIFLALITAVFFLGWAPLVLYSVVFDFFREELLPRRQSLLYVGYALSLAFGMVTTIANPILYTSLNEGFREAAPSFCRLCCCVLCWKGLSPTATSAGGGGGGASFRGGHPRRTASNAASAAAAGNGNGSSAAERKRLTERRNTEEIDVPVHHNNGHLRKESEDGDPEANNREKATASTEASEANDAEAGRGGEVDVLETDL